MTDQRPGRYRVTVHHLHAGKSTTIVDEHGTAFITAITTITPDGEHDIAEVHLHDSGPDLRRPTAQAVADQYLRSKQPR